MIDERGLSGLAGRGPAQSFDAVARHSRRVRLLKWAIPLIAVVAVCGFVGRALIASYRSELPKIEIAATALSGDNLTMEKPHLSGFNSQNQPYEVTAKSATQKVDSLGLVDLADLKAVIGMADKSTATFTAVFGQFDSKAQRLTLRQNVTVESTKDYSVDLSSAEVDFHSHVVTSQEPVTVKTANGEIKGGALRILNEGETITFSSGVSATFYGKSGSQKEPFSNMTGAGQ